MTLIGIGEFARLSLLSTHALRRYDEMGLLPPRRVDPESGYRWYASEQLDQARLVAALRQIGMPLARIKAVLALTAEAGSTASAAAAVGDWWSDAEADHASRRELAGFLVDRLNGKRSVMYDVSVRPVPARSVLCLLRHLRMDEFASVSRDFFDRFGDVPRLDGPQGASFVVYHGEVTEDSDGPVELCRPVHADDAVRLAARFPDLVLRTEAAHEEAFVRLARDPARTPSTQSLIVMETLLTWAFEQHRRPSGSVRQVFIAPRPAPGSGLGMECDFAVPLRAADRSDFSDMSDLSKVGMGARVSLGGAVSSAAAVSSGFTEAEGADLYFERRGEGPPLLMITGGGGDCAYYSAIAGILADSYTVVSYDRRGNSRSRLRGEPVPISMASQSADAVAVLAACGFSSAAVFGNSGGATIALDLAARYPSVPSVVVAHEPPVPRVLPDADEVLAVFGEVLRELTANGWRAAFTLFQTRIAGLPADQMTVLLDPATVLPPGPELDLLTRLSHNWEYMMRHEMRSFIDYVPSFDQLTASGVQIVVAAGSDTEDPFPRRVCAEIAGRLGTGLAEFPGGHTAPMEIPAAFARRLREVL